MKVLSLNTWGGRAGKDKLLDFFEAYKYIDIFEEKAIEYAKKLFKCEYANVQPHSGSSANMAVYKALLNH